MTLLLLALLPGLGLVQAFHHPLLPRQTLPNIPSATPTAPPLTPNACISAVNVIFSGYPSEATYPPAILSWFETAFETAINTIPPRSICDIQEMANKLSPPSDLKDAYSQYVSDFTGWQSKNHDMVHSVASSSCKGDVELQLQLEAMVMTDRKDCERWMSKYMGFSGPEETQSDDDSVSEVSTTEIASASASTTATVQVTTPVTTGVAAAATTTTTGTPNAGSRSTGLLGAVLGAVAGVVANV